MLTFFFFLPSLIILLLYVVNKSTHPLHGAVSPKVFFKSLNTEQLRIVENEFLFYQKLPAKSKKIFLRKTLYFLQSKTFLPKKGVNIDNRIIVYVAATAAQITLGLPLLRLPSFKNVIIYPTKYFNSLTRRYHFGEVNTRGAIVLSWEHVLKGYQNHKDGYNVALHELAHAVRLEDINPNDEEDYMQQKDINELFRLFRKKKKEFRVGQKMFLRKYAFTNLEEFFAVSVEYFFEQPLDFRTQAPELYQCICNILGQDTALLEEMNKR